MKVNIPGWGWNCGGALGPLPVVKPFKRKYPQSPITKSVAATYRAARGIKLREVIKTKEGYDDYLE